MAKKHTVQEFDVALDELSGLVRQMGELVLPTLEAAIQALIAHDHRLAAESMSAEPEVDALQARVRDRVVQLLTRQQPLAADLREVLVAERIARNLERIGDHTYNIARRSRLLPRRPPPAAAADIRWLSRQVGAQLREVLEAYRTREPRRVEETWAQDEVLDAQYRQAFENLLKEAERHPSQLGGLAHLMFVAKSLERIGDHATNIAEEVSFMITGIPVTRQRTR